MIDIKMKLVLVFAIFGIICLWIGYLLPHQYKLVSILDLQEYLNDMGCDPNIPEDGKPGPLTDAAREQIYEKQDYSALFRRAKGK